jgi:hypothetical protein
MQAAALKARAILASGIKSLAHSEASKFITPPKKCVLRQQHHFHNRQNAGQQDQIRESCQQSLGKPSSLSQ